MAIKVKFLSGQTEKKIDALHQWDYGQQLEIESEDLFPAIVEVHFSCSGMSEAKAQVCSMASGIATVDIPDTCLEQTGTITAWIYEIDGTQGRTTKSIVIPIISRARPDRTAEPTQEQKDYATELISEINEALDDLKSGNVVVKKAEFAEKADEATKTTSNSQFAEKANLADVATVAQYASNDKAKGTIENRFSNLESPSPISLREIFSATSLGAFAELTKNGVTESPITPGGYVAVLSLSKNDSSTGFTSSALCTIPEGTAYEVPLIFGKTDSYGDECIIYRLKYLKSSQSFGTDSNSFIADHTVNDIKLYPIFHF